MAQQPQMPAGLTLVGINSATNDLCRILARTLTRRRGLLRRALIPRRELCAELRAAYDAHMKLFEETQLPAEMNTAGALRVMMLELGCNNTPPLE